MVTILWILYGVFLGWMVTRLLPKQNDKLARLAIEKLAKEIGKTVCFYDFIEEAKLYSAFNGKEVATQKDLQESNAKNIELVDTLVSCAKESDHSLGEQIDALGKHFGVELLIENQPAKKFFKVVKIKKGKK